MVQQVKLTCYRVSTLHHACFSNQLIYSENVVIGATGEWLIYLNLPIRLSTILDLGRKQCQIAAADSVDWIKLTNKVVDQK